MMLLLQPLHIPRPHFPVSGAARQSFFLVSAGGLNAEIMGPAPFVAQVLERCVVGRLRASWCYMAHLDVLPAVTDSDR